MNIWQDLKERKILDKDGKVDALGPMGGQKLTSAEVSAYFRKHKVKDPEIKKAVEVALDLGGAFDVAGKEIQKFYGRKIRNSKEVKFALKYANESYEIKEGKMSDLLIDIQQGATAEDLKKTHKIPLSIAKDFLKDYYAQKNNSTGKAARKKGNRKEENDPTIEEAKSLKQLKSKYKKDVKNYNNNKDISQEGAMAFAYWAIKNGEIKTDDPDEFDQWLDDNLSEGTLTEASAFEIMQDIVKDKQAKKIKGTMVDMFTASVVVKAYDKVNDSNKKKIEKAPLETLVKLAHKVMGMKENMVEFTTKMPEKDRVQILTLYNKAMDLPYGSPAFKKVKKEIDKINAKYSKEETETNEWISKDGVRRRVAEKDQRKDVKEGDDSLGADKFQKPLKKKGYPHQEQLNVADTFRRMLESINEAPVLPSVQAGGMQDKPDHDIDKGVIKYVAAINDQIKSGEFAKMHKERGTEVKARKASKYWRVETWEMGKAGSIHAFIEIETGDIFKPAGWKAPAKGARGNVTDQRYINYVAKYPRAYHGGHLYK